MTTRVTDEMVADACEEYDSVLSISDEAQPHAMRAALEAALRSQGKVDQVTVCCSRRECGGECGNEWQGMRSVRRSGEDTIMAIMGADNMDHAIRILDEYASLTAIIGEGD